MAAFRPAFLALQSSTSGFKSAIAFGVTVEASNKANTLKFISFFR
jgi:hypothetical protein